MFNRTVLATSLALAFGTSALYTGAAVAQTTTPAPVEPTQLQRVEITGSAIKRIDAETAVPVTIIKLDEIKKEGITTTQQLVERLSSVQVQQGTSQSVGLGTGGAAFADLRGLGQNKTLVLLNGRRLANNAIDATAPDLNMIPFAALDRVEVLRDSASALYGTDAISGVINFITKRDYTGGTITLGADSSDRGGARRDNANAGFGISDESQRFNLFGFVDYQKQDRLRAGDRPYVDRSSKTSPTTFPGQYNQGGNVQHPLYPGCGAPNGIPTGDTATGTPGTNQSCGYLYARQVDLVPNTERLSGFLSGSFKITPDWQTNAEYFVSRNTNSTLIAGVPYGALAVNPGTPFYPGNGSTPLPSAFTLNPAYFPANHPDGAQPGYVRTRWRDQVSGGRAEKTDNIQQRLVLSLSGNAAGFDISGGLSYNENKLNDYLTGGYTDGTIITPGVLSGIINPFGDQTAAGTAYIGGALAKGKLFQAKGQVYTVDAKASREIGDWLHAGRAAAIAVGAEFRHEKFSEVGEPDFDTLVISSTGFDPATNNRGQRNVGAVFLELNVPLLNTLDVTGSVRYDHYGDFGGTTNPKVSFRYQPIQQLLVRGSASRGFRAPSLYDINAPQTYTNSANNQNDPVRCPGGTPIAGVSKSDNCAVQFLVLNGGNPNLQPERSKSFSGGFVLEPTANLNVSVDFWSIGLTKQIGVLDDNTIFGDPTKFAGLFQRAPDGSLATDGSLCPGPFCGYVTDTNQNLGNVYTNGIDFSGNYRLRNRVAGNFTFSVNSTWVHKYDYQNEPGGVYNHNVGIYSGTGPIFRWQHQGTVNWQFAQYTAGLTAHYKSGYTDQNADDEGNRVPTYTTVDVFGGWSPIKPLALILGVRNVLDRAPPFSNQASTFQTGYDPRFTDPIGRAFYVRGTYTF